MSRVSILQIVSFFIYLLYQVLILQNVVLFHTAFCFLYVAYLLVLPVETNPLALMGIGFIMGIAVDMFYDSLGPACVCLRADHVPEKLLAQQSYSARWLRQQ